MSTDAEFIRALEQGSLPADEFDHAAHLRAGYLYLRDLGFARAIERTRKTIGAFAAGLGRPERYHETITVAYLALIQQHLAERGDSGGWAGFARDNPDLFARDLLLDYYDADRLACDLARRTFLLPKRAAA